MAWHQMNADLAGKTFLNLLQRNDSGISMGAGAGTPRFNGVSPMVFIPKQELRDCPPLHIHCPRDNLPSFQEHDIGGYDFKLSIRTPCDRNTNWLYSETLNKLFIRMNKHLNVDITYKPKMPGEQLRIRAFICYLKEVSEPVLRCANHLSKDFATQHHIERENVLRCDNPSTVYCGNPSGKNIRDRYSVLVPLSTSTLSNQATQRQTLALKFACQNSCIGRKQTCLMFLLEDIHGVVLAQRWFYLKICSCPKRDKTYEERQTLVRSVAGESGSEDCKKSKAILKACQLSNTAANLIEDKQHFSLEPTASGGMRLIMEVSTKDIALATIEYAYSKECVNIVNQTKDAKHSVRCVRKLKRLCDEARKL